MLFGIILRRNFRTWIIRTAHYLKNRTKITTTITRYVYMYQMWVFELRRTNAFEPKTWFKLHIFRLVNVCVFVCVPECALEVAWTGRKLLRRINLVHSIHFQHIREQVWRSWQISTINMNALRASWLQSMWFYANHRLKHTSNQQS